MSPYIRQFAYLSGTLLFLLGTAAAHAEGVGEPLCRCLPTGGCLPPAGMLVLCEEAGRLAVYDRFSMLSREDRIQELLQQLRSGNAAARTRAITDLGMIGELPERVLQVISNSLSHDESKWVRRAAARALGRSRSRAVITALRAALHDGDEWVSHSAGEALRKIGLSGEPA